MESVPVSPRALKKALLQLDADIFCLQETKCQQGPGRSWNFQDIISTGITRTASGYSGTAVFMKERAVVCGLRTGNRGA